MSKEDIEFVNWFWRKHPEKYIEMRKEFNKEKKLGIYEVEPHTV